MKRGLIAIHPDIAKIIENETIRRNDPKRLPLGARRHSHKSVAEEIIMKWKAEQNTK